MKQPWILVVISIFFVVGITIMFPLLGCMILMFRLARKAFLSAIFLMIKVHLSNKTNLDTDNNLHSFCYGHYNHVLLIGIHNINALDLVEKLFFPPFSL